MLHLPSSPQVLASWKKNTYEMITFVKDNILNFLNKNKHHVYILQLLTELREQSLKDQKLIKDCPVVEPLTTNIMRVALSARNYVSWKFNIDGNMDMGSTKQPHNRLARLMAFEGYRSGRLSFYLYHDVKQMLEMWKQQGMRLILYSAMGCDEIWDGKNLLGYTSYGDLQDVSCVGNFLSISLIEFHFNRNFPFNFGFSPSTLSPCSCLITTWIRRSRRFSMTGRTRCCCRNMEQTRRYYL